MTLIRLILDKSERNSKDWKKGAIGNRSIRIQQKELDLLGKQNLLKQAEELENEGLIWCERFSNDSDISVIRYSLDRLSILYKKADVIPKSDRISKMQNEVNIQLKKTCKIWIKSYYEYLLSQLDQGKEPNELKDSKIEMTLKCFSGIDKLESPIFKKIFSKRYLGGSKIFENEMENHVVSVAKKFCEEIDDDMTSSEVLIQINLDNYSTELSVKGDLIIKLNNSEIDLSAFTYGAVLNSETLKHLSISQNQKIKKIITVENKANYIAFPYEEGTLVIFSHGFFSPSEKAILKELASNLKENKVEYYHTGDLDYGGIQIFEYIRSNIFPLIKPMYMDVETWNKYSKYGYQIEVGKLNKLKCMLDNEKLKNSELKELAEMICKTGIGIEQESFLFKD